MRKSLQNEIPKARVNIRLDVDTGGSIEKKRIAHEIISSGRFQPRKN